jgi:ATP-dependent exoDNAse (exonuclease V) beta subunit
MTSTGDFENPVDAASHKALSTLWASQLGVASDDLEFINERVALAIDGTLNDEKGRWLLEGNGFSELPITGLWKGRVSSIVIDRIRIDDDGVHWIVDYKTSTHEGGDLATFLHHESIRYRDQLNKYAGIYSAMSGAEVRTALYFPMLQEFCEV